MQGCSGAESKAVCTEAGMYALRERRSYITQEDFQLAVTKIMNCLLYTSPSPRDLSTSRMPSSA